MTKPTTRLYPVISSYRAVLGYHRVEWEATVWDRTPGDIWAQAIAHKAEFTSKADARRWADAYVAGMAARGAAA